ncbi:RHS repeat-associated core domain-containing protein [Streptacidiphilus sp. EB129]|uniref:RHS repeat-associated core domain-containing protein n=1 Tax=Streptacidiphilus sp. EB129 TaxID=3156262 RepID=UPI003514B6BA
MTTATVGTMALIVPMAAATTVGPFHNTQQLWSKVPLAQQQSLTGVAFNAKGQTVHPKGYVPVENYIPQAAAWPAASTSTVTLTQATPAASAPGGTATSPAASGAATPPSTRAPHAAGTANGTPTAPAGASPTAAPPLMAVTGPVRAGSSPVSIAPVAAGAVGGKARSLAAAAPGTAMPAKVQVQVLSHTQTLNAGINGLLLGVSRADGSASSGQVKVAVDYASIAKAYGGGFASRLYLVAYPACVLTTPQVAACRTPQPLASANNLGAQQLTATVTLPGATAPRPGAQARSQVAGAAAAQGAPVMALGAISGTSGSQGSYTASNIGTSAGTWSESGTGAFTYSYPIEVPPSLGGAAPAVALSYDSQSEDGETSARNAQASWIGDGWSYSPGFIEQSFRPCATDGVDALKKSGDECWGGFNGTMSFDGHDGVLVPIGVQSGVANEIQAFKLQNDDGTLVQEFSGAANGLANGAYFKITTIGGEVAYFGLGHAPAASGGVGANTDAATNSAWGVPVYCPNSGDPCYNSSTGTGSHALMGYKFNLDFTVDLHSNLQRLDYTAETGYYNMGAGQASNSTGTMAAYTRGGYLTKISYGYQLADEAAGKNPAAEVDFATAPRCNATATFPAAQCTYANLNATTAPNWPDIPYDLNCNQGDGTNTTIGISGPQTGTCYTTSPTFWSEARLDSITTQVRVGGVAKTVDSYQLGQVYSATGGNDPVTGTTVDPKDAASLQAVLWLQSVTHTGQDTTAGATASASLNQVTFTGTEIDNRANDDMTGGTSSQVPLYRPRIATIQTETGESIAVTYNQPSCAAPNTPTAPDSNTSLCYPVYWSNPGAPTPTLEYFNKSTVHSVAVADLVAGSETQVSTYGYTGPAWHRDDSDLTDDQYRTWDQFHGFHTVTVTTGDPNSKEVLTQSTTTYLQGMDGDYKADGTRRSVTAQATAGGNVVQTLTDSNPLTGMPLQADTYTQAGGSIVATSVSGPVAFSTTTTHPRTAWTSQSPAPSGGVSTLPDLTALRVQSSSGSNYSQLANGTWRKATTATNYDTQGRPTSVDTFADANDASTERCSTTSYAASASNPMLLAFPDETRSVAGPCSTVPDATHPALSDARMFYDGDGTITNPGTLGSLGAHADVTATQKITSYTGSQPNPTTESAMTYDAYGRITKTLDVNGRATTTAFTSGVGELPTLIRSTNPQGWVTRSYMDPLRGLATRNIDANNAETDITYDALGRRTAVWLPGRYKSQSQSADLLFSYAINPGAKPGLNGTVTTPGGPSAVTTQTLREDGSYSSSVTLYDGMLQQRETQSNSGSDVGSTTADRLVSDTFYDSHGWAVRSYAPYWDQSTGPGTTLSVLPENSVPAETVSQDDGLGRTTNSQLYHNGIYQWQSTSSYPGADETDATSPAGGPSTSTFSNALGETNSTVVKNNAATVSLSAGQIIASGTSLTSASTRLAMQSDGNLVLSSLATGKALWSSNTSGNTGAWAIYQADGNFVVYDAGRTKTLWSAGTTAAGGSLKLQNDANLVVADPSGTTVWSSNTAGQAPEADSTTRYTYTPAGQVATVQDTAGNTWSYAYDMLGQKTSQSDPNTGTSTFGPYDNQGNLQQTTDSRGQTLSYQYDWDNRMVGEYSGAWSATPSPSNQLSGTTYDTLKKGYPTSSTRYVGGNGTGGSAYTQAVTGYNASYQPTGESLSIPSADGFPQAPNTTAPTGTTTYSVTPTYSATTGQLNFLQYNADAGLPAETVTYSYSMQGSLTGMGSSTGAAYLDLASHDGFGRTTGATYGTYGQELTTSATYDDTTGRLDQTTASLQVPNTVTDATSYRYNQVGALTAVDDAQNGATVHDTQCFSYDAFQRLSQAWSDTAGITNPTSTTVGEVGGCNTTTPQTTATAPITTSTVGGPAAYWESYTYDLLGDRTGMVNHDPTGNALNNTTQTTSYNGTDGTTSASQPNQAGPTTTSNPTTGTGTLTPGYLEADGKTNAGNTTSRTATGTASLSGTSQTLTYDAEGRTHSVTTPAGSTSYLYDASGNLLEQTGPTIKVLYLFGGAEQITQYTGNGNTAVNALRNYAGPDGTTITRDQSGTINYQIGNTQGTATTLINAATDAVTRRYYDPYGNPRGPVPSTWGDKSENRGFLGQPQDPTTGLDLLGARNYDPTQGRFLTPDPLFEAGDPNQMGGYTYAGDSPSSGSDPTGLALECADGPTGPCQSGPGRTPTTSTTKPGPKPNPAPTTTSSGNTTIVGGNTPGTSGDTTPGWVTGVQEAGVVIIAGSAGASLGWECEEATFGFIPAACLEVAAGAVGGLCALFEGDCGSLPTDVGGDHEAFHSDSAAELASADKAAATAAVDSASTGASDGTWGTGSHLDDSTPTQPATPDPVKAAKTATSNSAAPGEPAKGTSGTEPAKDDSAGTGCHSFLPDTEVLMADGTVKKIKDIKPGDKVLATDPLTGKTTAREVTRLITTPEDQDFADLTIAAKNGSAHLTATVTHPFWVVSYHAWIDAGNLRPGMAVETSDGTATSVLAVRAFHHAYQTNDLTVATTHTYYVLAGTTPILVHNCNGSVATHSTKCDCANGAAPRIPRNPYGARGKLSTQIHIDEVRDELLDANPDWVHVAGGTDRATGAPLPEQTIFGPNGEPRRPDLSFILPDGSPFFVNTVDTLSDGVTADSRELANAIDINMWGGGPVLMIPKPG